MSSFPCIGCGACCKETDWLLDAGFPVENDACAHLIDDQCSIYETRPDVCRVDLMGDRLGMPKRENYERTAKCCNKLMGREGVTQDMIEEALEAGEGFEPSAFGL